MNPAPGTAGGCGCPESEDARGGDRTTTGDPLLDRRRRIADELRGNDGYVHWAWWNNVLEPYLGGPVWPGLTFTNPLTGVVHPPTPGGVTAGAGFAPPVHELDIQPKAVPEDEAVFPFDYQTWTHRPLDPDLCLVSDDLVAAIGHLLSEQAVPVGPTTTATPVPAPNDHGWHNEDVLVRLTATTDAGRTITGIEYAMSGAQSQGATIADGGAVEVTIVEEGDTTITFFARDDGGVVEPGQSMTIRLDKTPPAIVSAPRTARQRT